LSGHFVFTSVAAPYLHLQNTPKRSYQQRKTLARIYHRRLSDTILASVQSAYLARQLETISLSVDKNQSLETCKIINRPNNPLEKLQYYLRDKTNLHLLSDRRPEP